MSGILGLILAGGEIFSLSISTTSVSESAASGTRNFLGEPTVTPSGGAAPYAHSWAISDQTGGSWSITSGSTAAKPEVQVTGVGPTNTATATLTDTVTDAVGVVRQISCAFSFLNTTPT